MNVRKLTRRDWIMVLVIGGVVAAYAVLEDPEGSPAGTPGQEAGAASPPASLPASPPASQVPAPDGVTRFRPHTVVDRTGFGQPVDAVSVLVPDGWGFESRVTWAGVGGFCSSDHAGVFWEMTSPDGTLAISSHPGILVSTWPDTFQGRGLQPTGYCHLGSVESHQQFAEQVLVPTLRPGNRILEVEEITDLPPDLRRMAESRTALDAMVGGRTVPAGTSVVTRTHDGRYDEVFLVTYLITDMPPPSPGVPPFRMVQTSTPIMLRAPAGEPERIGSLAATILATVRYNPGWQRAIQQLDDDISRNQAEAAGARSRILAESFREVGEIQMSGWQSRMDADWRGSRSVADALAGLSRQVDPHTGREVTLDGLGTRYFANAHGEYLVVDAPDVDPRRLFPSEDWQEMASANRPR